MKKSSPTKHERLSRRDLLTIGSAGLLGLALPDILRQEAHATPSQPRRRAQNVILVWCEGGPSTIDMWDMKPDGPDGIRGEFRPIRTRADGIQICEHMPRLADVMDRCTLVRSLHHSIPEHGSGNIFMITGHPPSPLFQYPSMGSLAAHLLPAARGIPPYFRITPAGDIGLIGNAGHLGGAYNPCEVVHTGSPLTGALLAQAPIDTVAQFRVDGFSLPQGFTADQLRDRDHLRNVFDARFRALDDSGLAVTLDRFHQEAIDILGSPRVVQAFDLTRETPAARTAYGRNLFGQTMLAARRLIEAGTRFVAISAKLPSSGSANPWDSHNNNFQVLRNDLLPWLDQGLAALVADIRTRGLLESTIVYCVGEFGRTPRINNIAGRDHWPRSMAALLAGGGLQPGYVHGSTNRTGEDPDQNPCSPADVLATIFHQLGFEPHHEVPTPTGRRLPIFREGRVIEAMLA
jgi:hypothetical protein